jgi:hypothetical protein
MDASGFQGGAMWGTERVGQLFGERDRAPFRSANWRELYMPLVALRTWGDRWRGRRVLVVTDSDVTRSVIARQGSRAVDLNDLYKEIALECARWEVDLAARHIPGKENVEPDNISRWAREFDRSDWMFRSDEVEVIEAMTGPHAVDSHADVLGLNALMPMHWHRRKPAELQDWRGLLVWCNGDYADLGPALRRFWECQRADASGGATFVVPFWPTAPWWRWLKGFKLLRWYPEDYAAKLIIRTDDPLIRSRIQWLFETARVSVIPAMAGDQERRGAGLQTLTVTVRRHCEDCCCGMPPLTLKWDIVKEWALLRVCC